VRRGSRRRREMEGSIEDHRAAFKAARRKDSLRLGTQSTCRSAHGTPCTCRPHSVHLAARTAPSALRPFAARTASICGSVRVCAPHPVHLRLRPLAAPSICASVRAWRLCRPAHGTPSICRYVRFAAFTVMLATQAAMSTAVSGVRPRSAGSTSCPSTTKAASALVSFTISTSRNPAARMAPR